MEENLNFSLEEAFGKLDELVKKLENKEISLEDSFKFYKEGVELIKKCQESVDTIEKKVLLLNEDGATDEF
ncbi:Exodeoxyribonuclease VII small subunit [Acetitomaculum ruminis DSM 5522]|uniref:Exodeoxyribonuclease 7 small subunit n=1 Tax=Acetitomaculum ruminis DSM 5522 TaxID=1120918 RepID=A0A1I0VT17_9FIRM|nr:exodeoxyribonuclease VII small subunit [Acetitomaculum ruminis]SFA79504.1 Exodeoxyribonuclease VII small subunit [Acetitomaculum ruminis DSM 5522]